MCNLISGCCCLSGEKGKQHKKRKNQREKSSPLGVITRASIPRSLSDSKYSSLDSVGKQCPSIVIVGQLEPRSTLSSQGMADGVKASHWQ